MKDEEIVGPVVQLNFSDIGECITKREVLQHCIASQRLANDKTNNDICQMVAEQLLHGYQQQGCGPKRNKSSVKRLVESSFTCFIIPCDSLQASLSRASFQCSS